MASMNREEKIKLIQLKKEKRKRRARNNLLAFAMYTYPKFQATWFHKKYYNILDLFAKGVIKKLIITIPPQHGKSLGSTINLPAFLLGLNPDLKIAITSYNTVFARKFNRSIQRLIDSEEYRELFPETQINSKNVVTNNNYLRNADEFEIVDREGGVKGVGRGGALTGNPVDILINDDIYKDYEEGNSPIILDSAWNFYTTVADTRLHNDSQQLIVFTRWNQGDLVGRIEDKETVVTLDKELEEYDDKVWYKINFEAIKISEKTDLDPRDIDDPLWPERHSLEKLKRSQSLDPENFNSLYQGNPQPREGLLYSGFVTYDTLPELIVIDNYTDVADTGKDYLCSGVYGIDDENKIYLLDVLYTPEAQEKTEPWTAALLERNNVVTAHIESNNGGRGFARNVEKLINSPITIDSFHQSGNKESRIYTNSAAVQQRVHMPSDWSVRWPDFYMAVTTYRKNFKANKFDDAPDMLSGIIEKVDNDGLSILDAL